MNKDNFWKYFWMIVGFFLCIGVGSICWLKISYINLPEDTNRALAVGAFFDPLHDPFASSTRQKKTLAIVSGYFYQDSLPLGFEDWSWDADVSWRNREQPYSGSYSAKATFLAPWAGIRLHGPDTNLSQYQSLEISVNPDQNIRDLYIELQDKYGNSIGRQSIGWYTASSTLSAGQWNTVSIPLENFLAQDNLGHEITGFSVSSEQTGTAYVDSVRLSKTPAAHTKWIMPVSTSTPYTWVGSDPFTGITQIDLPYHFEFNTEQLQSWRQLFGLFDLTKEGIRIGAIPKKTNGSMTVFGGGKNWTDYRIDAKVYWGITATFSILTRFTDDANFVSCAYSNYGAIVQIYSMKNGESTLISQTPQLAIRDYEPWKNVPHAVEVRGNRVSCFMDGERVLSATLPNMSPTGTVGLETWTTNSHDYPHTLLSLTVTSL